MAGRLEATEIVKRFGRQEVLSGVSVSLDAAPEITGLIGPNGAGKTVLLNCINGLYRPDRGAIRFNGRDIVRLRPYDIASLGIARSFQLVELFRHMTVLENVLLGLHTEMKTSWVTGGVFWGPGRKEEERARRKAEDVLDFFELYVYRRQSVASLPFGVQKLVGLARALAAEPKLLLLDEPASGLNREEREDLARFLLRIKYELKIPMLWVEHDLEMITQLAGRIVCLHYGHKIAEGTPGEVTTNGKVIEAYVGHSPTL